MWAIKNFVCGPSASVAIGRRPYPGAIKQTANATRPPADNLTEPYNVVLWWGAMWAVSTQPGGSLGVWHFAGCNTLVGGMWTMWASVF